MVLILYHNTISKNFCLEIKKQFIMSSHSIVLLVLAYLCHLQWDTKNEMPLRRDARLLALTYLSSYTGSLYTNFPRTPAFLNT